MSRRVPSSSRMILSDLPTPAEASFHATGPCKGFAQAGNRFTLFGIMRPPADAALFNSPTAFFTALLGPPQHDAHVACWRGELWLRARRADSARGLAAVDDFVAQLRETEAQRLAETHGYDTAALAREFHRFDSGCFSRRPFARTHARQLRRAIEIACARRDAELQAGGVKARYSCA